MPLFPQLNKRFLAKIATAACALAVLLGAWVAQGGPTVSFLPSEPKLAGYPSFVTEAGTPHTIREWEGKVIMLHFWATWCAPCVKELPAIDKFQQDYAEKNIIVLPISLDLGQPDAVRKFYATNGISHLPVYLDKDMGMYNAYKVKGVPSTIILNSFGYETARAEGTADWNSATTRAFIDKALNP